MSYKPNDVVYFEFGTQNTSGGATNADSTPTAVLRRNGTVDATVTITIAATGTTGGYKGSFTIPSGYVAGDTLVVSVQVIVGGTTSPPYPVFHTVVDTARASDIPLAVWNILRSVTFTANSIGEKVKAWLATLGADNKIVLSSDAHTGAVVPVVTTTGTVTNPVTVGTNNDKTGYDLSSPARESLAVVVEEHLLDEGDGQQIVNMIVGAIGNQNIDQAVLVAALRADIERNGGLLASIFLDYARRTGDYATGTNVTAAQNALTTLIEDVPTVAEFNARTRPSADYALEATFTTIKGGGWTNQTLVAIMAQCALKLNAADYVAPNNAGIGNAAASAATAATNALSASSEAAAAKAAAQANKTTIDKQAVMIEPDGEGYRWTQGSLAEAPTGSGGSGGSGPILG